MTPARRGLVGVVANPSSGKDIRRLVAHASVASNAEKRSMLVRAAVGAAEAGVAAIAYLPDRAGLAASALEGLRELDGVDVAPLDIDVPSFGAADTTAAARALRAAGCGAVLVVGGDGTNRALALGWPDAPVVAVSTGTNNAFPVMVEPTIAGAAAGLVAAGRLALADVARRAKAVHLAIDHEAGDGEDGTPDATDLALVDAVLVSEAFVGARAIADPGAYRAAVLARAAPDAMGVCGLAGLVRPCAFDEDGGVALGFARAGGADGDGDGDGDGVRVLRAPVAPGRYDDVGIAADTGLALGERVTWSGPGVVALDGERERVLHERQRATVWVERDGPWVIDVGRALAAAARQRLYFR